MLRIHVSVNKETNLEVFIFINCLVAKILEQGIAEQTYFGFENIVRASAKIIFKKKKR